MASCGRSATLSAGIYWFNQHVLDAVVNGAAGGSKGLSGGIMWIDRNIIDGVVNGAGTATGNLRQSPAHVQSGNVQWYAVGLFGGVVALTLFVFR